MGVLYIGSLLKLHGLDSCVKLSWQSVKDQIAVLINSYYVIWLELFWVNKACQWKVYGLSVCCLYYHCLVAFLRGLLIYLKDLVYSCNQIRKLLEIIYFLITVLNVLLCLIYLLLDLCFLALHDSDVVLEDSYSVSYLVISKLFNLL